MSNISEYKIKFKGLPKGVHLFDFLLDDYFFANFDETIIKNAKISVKLKLTVKTDLLELQFELNGTVTMPCDVCLDDTNTQISGVSNLKVSFADESSDITDVDEHLVLAKKENFLDLSQHLYEYAHLSLPTKIVHPTDSEGNSTCNKIMLEKLEELQPKSESKIDPRWEKLQELYN